MSEAANQNQKQAGSMNGKSKHGGTLSLAIQELKWSNIQETQESINLLFQEVEHHACESIAWYERKKTRKASMSSVLRLLAIFWTTLGGLTPILGSIGWHHLHVRKIDGAVDLGNLGYLFLGLAAACIGLDKYFGFSSGWMRYITTMMVLERSRAEFRFDWAMMVAKLAEKPPTPDQVQLMIQRLKEFLVAVDTQVELETQAWVSEFKTNLAEIEKTTKAQAEAGRPGAIDITLTNGMKAEDGFTVAIDGMEVKRVRGTKYQIGYVPPGPHKIAVSATVGGQQVDASELVNVAPGAISNVTLALPIDEAQP